MRRLPTALLPAALRSAVRPSAVLLPAMLALATGCGFTFERPSQVVDRRILGIRVEPPEIVFDGSPPPASVQVQALVVDRGDSTAPVSFTWRACLPGMGGTGEQRAGEGTDPETGRCDTTGEPLGAGSGPMDGLAATVPVKPEMALAAQAAAERNLAVSLYLQVELKVDSPQGELFGQKRLVLSPPLPEGRRANRNPRLAALLFDGQPWLPDAPLEVRRGSCGAGDVQDVPAGEPDWLGERPMVRVCTHRILPVFDEAQAESYRAQNFDGTLVDARERLRFSWFADAGSFDRGQTSQPVELGPEVFDPLTTQWREPAGVELSTVWVVVRDGRGGESWERRQVRLLPP